MWTGGLLSGHMGPFFEDEPLYSWALNWDFKKFGVTRTLKTEGKNEVFQSLGVGFWTSMGPWTANYCILFYDGPLELWGGPLCGQAGLLSDRWAPIWTHGLSFENRPFGGKCRPLEGWGGLLCRGGPLSDHIVPYLDLWVTIWKMSL